jgi:F-box and leucine-rich repeat protein 2/20
LLLGHTKDFPLDFKSLNFSNNGDIHTDVLVFLSRKMKNLTSLTCSGMISIHKSDLFFIADCFPLLEELDLSYPMSCCKYDFIRDNDDHQLLALPKLRKINLSGNCIKDHQSINYLFKNCNLLEEVIMNDLISMVDVDCDCDWDSDTENDSDSDNDSDSASDDDDA